MCPVLRQNPKLVRKRSIRLLYGLQVYLIRLRSNQDLSMNCRSTARRLKQSNVRTADGVKPRSFSVCEKSPREKFFLSETRSRDRMNSANMVPIYLGKCCANETVSTSTVNVCPAKNSATSRRAKARHQFLETKH